MKLQHCQVTCPIKISHGLPIDDRSNDRIYTYLDRLDMLNEEMKGHYPESFGAAILKHLIFKDKNGVNVGMAMFLGDAVQLTLVLSKWDLYCSDTNYDSSLDSYLYDFIQLMSIPNEKLNYFIENCCYWLLEINFMSVKSKQQIYPTHIIQVGDFLTIPPNTNFFNDKLKSVIKSNEDTIVKITKLLGAMKFDGIANAYGEIHNLIDGNLTSTGDTVEIRLQNLKPYKP